jgi:hypothetical protein
MPDPLKDKGIPQKYANIFINVFNSVMDRGGDESSAYRQAYGVMIKELRKAGYRQGRDKKWHKSKTKESMTEADIIYALPLAPTRSKIVICEGQTLEGSLAQGLRFKGVSLVDYAISQQGTFWQRYYSPEFNDRAMSRTKDFMGLGHTVTIYNTHGAAFGGFFSLPSESPIGKIAKVWREADEIQYEGFISPTAKGRDQIQLIFDGIVGETSVRIADPKYETRRLQDPEPGKEEETPEEYIDELLDGFIIGIDFCDEAGIPGAGMTGVLESAPHWAAEQESDSSDSTEEDENMEWDKVTLEELKAKVPDLLNAHVTALLEAANAQITQLKAQVAEVGTTKTDLTAAQAQVTQLTTSLEAATTKIAGLEAEAKLRQAAETPLGKTIYAELAKRNPKPEELEVVLKEAREAALTQLALEIQGEGGGGKGSAKGKTAPGEGQSDVGDPGSHTEDVPEGFTEQEAEELYRHSAR